MRVTKGDGPTPTEYIFTVWKWQNGKWDELGQPREPAQGDGASHEAHLGDTATGYYLWSARGVVNGVEGLDRAGGRRFWLDEPDADIGRGAAHRDHILDCFNRNGRHASVGNPLNDAHWWGNTTPVVIQDFGGGGGGRGAIIDNEGVAHDTAYWVHGGIWEKYVAMGGPDGVLRRPRSDELAANRSPQGSEGRISFFEGGGIYHSPSLGTFGVYGAIFQKYAQPDKPWSGGTGGILGFPITDEFGTARSAQGTSGTVSLFEGGQIYHSVAYGNYVIYGAILQKYAAVGGIGSRLGFVTSDPIAVQSTVDGRQGTYQTFEGGWIVSSEFGTYIISGDGLTQWLAQGGVNGPGFPLGDAYDYKSGLRQNFQRTYVTSGFAVLFGVTVNPASVPGGVVSRGTVTLSGPAPAGGALVTLASDNAVAVVPNSVTVAEGASSASFDITTRTVSASVTATITGVYEFSRTAALTVTPMWKAADVAVDGNNKTHILWSRADGAVRLRTLTAGGLVENTLNLGSFSGLKPRSLSIGADGKWRILLNATDGSTRLWVVSATGVVESNFSYPSEEGWAAVGLVTGSDNKTRVLWNKDDADSRLWLVNAAGTVEASTTFGVLIRQTPRAVSVGLDNKGRVLWAPKSRLYKVGFIWTMLPSGQREDNFKYGLETNWIPIDIVTGVDNTSRVLLIKTDGSAVLWNVNQMGDIDVSTNLGALVGEAIRSVGMGDDGKSRVLSTRVNGQVVVRVVTAAGNNEGNFVLDPD